MRFPKLLFLLLLLNLGWQHTTAKSENANDSTIKILAIGNSFSQDAIETYLFELADAAGKKVIIGNLYIGGASLELHWNNAKDDKAAYQYRKIDVTGNKPIHLKLLLPQH